MILIPGFFNARTKGIVKCYRCAWVVFVFLIFPGMLISSSSPLYDVGQYEQAREGFEKLSLQKLSPLQQTTVDYDIATCLLAEGKIKKAIDKFSSIHLSEESFPPLAMRFNMNYALALVVFTQDFIKQLQLGGIEDVEYQQNPPMLLLYTGYQKIEEAKKAANKLLQVGLHPPIESLEKIKNGLDYSLNQLTMVQSRQRELYLISLKNILLENSYIKVLYDVMKSYQLVLAHDSIHSENLAKVSLDMLKQQEYKDQIKAILMLHQMSLEYLDKKKNLAAWLILDIVFRELKILSDQTVNKQKKDPSIILEAIIEEEKQALQSSEVARLLYSDDSEIARRGDLVEIAKDMQKRVLGKEKMFLKAVVQEQENTFQESSSQAQRDRCHHRWESVLSLYYKGSNFAQDASHEFVQDFTLISAKKEKTAQNEVKEISPGRGSPKGTTLPWIKEDLEGISVLSAIIEKQKTAVYYWKQALENLQRSFRTDERLENQITPTHDDKKMPLSDIRMLLEQMDSDDTSLDQTQSASNEGNRPW